MSGVMQAEQRLDRLKKLRAQIDREIDQLEQEEAYRQRRKDATAGQPRTRRQKAENRVDKHLELLGVTAHDVKVWAVSVGLLDAVRRGRIKGELVDAYEDAHREEISA